MEIQRDKKLEGEEKEREQAGNYSGPSSNTLLMMGLTKDHLPFIMLVVPVLSPPLRVEHMFFREKQCAARPTNQLCHSIKTQPRLCSSVDIASILHFKEQPRFLCHM